MNKILVTITLITSISFAQYIIKNIVLDAGGKKITTSNYICQLSFGQQIASRTLTSSNYYLTLGFWNPTIVSRVGIEEESQKYLFFPLTFSLSQCYPNPFKNKILIRYSIPIETYVNLKILNTTGRVVRTLVNGIQKPGVYNVTWDLKNVSQSQLPNGVYFCRLEAGEFKATKKIIKAE
ncbi:MAG: T9SS type A sorting domain-containing protein [Candidatus Omnitrophica bacterium]|nr:T9SS type A sorting domain-containing protein [Candidatus Omnitrophota bacterium]